MIDFLREVAPWILFKMYSRKQKEYGLYRESIRVLSKIIFYLLQVGCNFEGGEASELDQNRPPAPTAGLAGKQASYVSPRSMVQLHLLQQRWLDVRKKVLVPCWSPLRVTPRTLVFEIRKPDCWSFSWTFQTLCSTVEGAPSM